MSDIAATRTPTDWKDEAMRKRIRRRYAAERRFRLLGLGAILISAAFLAFLLVTMLSNGLGGFRQTELRLDMIFPSSALTASSAGGEIEAAVAAAAEAQYGKDGARMLSDTAWMRVERAIKDDPAALGRKQLLWVPASSPIDSAAKGDGDAA